MNKDRIEYSLFFLFMSFITSIAILFETENWLIYAIMIAISGGLGAFTGFGIGKRKN